MSSMLVRLKPVVKKSRSAASRTNSVTSGLTSLETSEPVWVSTV